MTTPAQQLVWVPDGASKTELVRALALQGSIDPLVRQTSVRLMAGTGRYDHRARLERLHRFVRDVVPYHREAVEMLQPAAFTLLEGGDCDDHAILLGALAWALRYPFIVEPVGNIDAGGHYSMRLGMPPSDEPHGDADTIWFSTETTIPALFGEHVLAASRRIGRFPL